MMPRTPSSYRVRQHWSGREALLSSQLGFAPSLQEAKKLFFAPCRATALARKSRNNKKRDVEED